MTAPSPQEAEDELDEILNQLHDYYNTVYNAIPPARNAMTKQRAKAAIASYTAKQVLEAQLLEIVGMAREVGPEIKGETWEDWSFRVLAYMEKRKTELQQARKDLEDES